jgi:hypothetical protein
MVRATNLFAVASVALLVSGLVLSNFFEKAANMSVRWPGSHTGYIIGCQVPCYGLAALFAIFGCFYAVGWIRLGEALAGWHLWLSLSGVAMFVFGFALLARVAGEGAAPQSGQGTLLVIAGGMLLGPAIFAAGQLLLIIALLARFAAQHH